jgi:deoxyribose-phosphate aldolase
MPSTPHATPADTTALARRALAALDFTRLGDDDTPADILALAADAALHAGAPAALCVHPEHVTTARRALDALGLQAVRVATVVNFPDGGTDAARVTRETRRALGAGADEIDLVLPWRALLAGDEASVEAVLAAGRAACPGRVLKVILETGMLEAPASIRRAGELALAHGADMLKTSTGKVAVNATPEAAAVLLELLADRGGLAGLKIAGGVRTLDDAATYFALADRHLGPDWATPARFRIGASGLMQALRAALGEPSNAEAAARGGDAYAR